MRDLMKNRIAQKKVLDSIHENACLPGQVFNGLWGQYFFFESDHIFTNDFLGVLNNLLTTEGSSVCCLLNLGESKFRDLGSSAAYFIDKNTTGDSYQKFLKGDAPGHGWLYGMDSYGLSSESGEWCIYCEKANDVAIMAFKDVHGYQPIIQQIDARTIDKLVDTSNRFPFDELTEEWKRGLLNNYL